MAEKIVSPGVFTRENDLSFLAQGIGEIGAAIVGPFAKGPAFLPTVVNTQSEFEQLFGTPDGQYYTGYAVQNYLREAGTVTIVRVGHIGGYTHESPVAIVVTDSEEAGGNSRIVATLHSTAVGDNENVGFSDVTISSQSGSAEFLISGSSLFSSSLYSGPNEASASILPSAGNDIADVFGQSPFGNKGAYTYTYFEKTAVDTAIPFASGAQVELVELPAQEFSGDVSFAETPFIVSQNISGERHDLFKFETLGDGGVYNTEYKVAISNVRAAGVSNATDYATFTVTIRGFADTDKRKSILETYNNVNLDPASPNYIAKLIGDRRVTIDANGKQTETGDYANRSKLVRVIVSQEGTFPIIAAPFGHKAYTNPIFVGDDETLVPAVIYSTGSAENTASNTTRFAGIDLETATVRINNNQYLKPLPLNAETGANTDFAFDGDITAVVGGVVVSDYNFNYSLSTSDSTAVIAQRQFIVGFQGGFDGVSPTQKVTNTNDVDWPTIQQGFNCGTSLSSGSVAYVRAINSVSNPDDFDINLIVAPGIIRNAHPFVFDYIVEMVESREDAFFIGELSDYNATIDSVVDEASNVDSNYVGTYYPWVKTIDRNTNKLTTVPPSVLMPGIYAANDAVAAEWFAPAGLNRGGIVGAVSVLNRLTHSERDTLYEGKVNPIASFPGEGIVAFGQKTLQDKASALDRINVRRLLIKVKKYIASTSRYLVFEQNTATTRSRFLNTVNPYLEAIQQRQGLFAFRVVMDETNNTPDVIDRNILAGQIFLQPTKTAEFIVLDFNILPTGASFTA
jgi:hypothetical protein